MTVAPSYWSSPPGSGLALKSIDYIRDVNFTFRLHRGDEITLCICFAIELGNDLDGLSPRKKVVEGNPCDTGHLGIVDQAQ
jgi:hypothetical protein